MNHFKTLLLRKQMLELKDSQDNLIELFIGHSDRFCLSLNCKLIKATKGWTPIAKKLHEFDNLEIVD